jgi:hypothetical protein
LKSVATIWQHFAVNRRHKLSNADDMDCDKPLKNRRLVKCCQTPSSVAPWPATSCDCAKKLKNFNIPILAAPFLATWWQHSKEYS